MRILIVYSDLRCSCTRKGTFELSRGLKLFTPTDILHHLELKEYHFKKYDVILFQRLGGNGALISESYYLSLENLIKKYKGITYTAYFLDDLIINAGTKRMMGLVDKLLVPNPNYLKYVTEYNDDLFYTRTFLDLEEISSIRKKNLSKKNINLLWASTGGVGASFMKKLLPALLKKIPNAVVHIVGGSSSRFREFKNTKIYPILPYAKFIQYFKACDIYLNPISIDTAYFRNVKTIDFFNCKSELKYIIAGAVKKPILSSKSQPYEYAIKSGINGILLNNDVNSWIAHIIILTKNLKLKTRLTKNAYDDVSKNYTLKAVGEKIYYLFQEFFEKKNTEIKCNQPLYFLDNNQPESNSIVGEIFGNKKIHQSFMCKDNGLFKIDLRFATYIRKNKGILRISLTESLDGNTIRTKDLLCEKLYDNEWHSLLFDPILNSKGKKYFIKIEGINCRIGSSVTVYYLSSPHNIGELLINRTKFNGSLTFKTYNRNSQCI